jgi:hypothetical protein
MIITPNPHNHQSTVFYPALEFKPKYGERPRIPGFGGRQVWFGLGCLFIS